MGKWDKFRATLMEGRSDNNLRFSDVTTYLKRLGFEERIEGSHHSFRMEGIPLILVMQPQSDGKAKAYQVKQVRAVINDFGL